MGIDQFDCEKEADNLIFTFSVNFCAAQVVLKSYSL